MEWVSPKFPFAAGEPRPEGGGAMSDLADRVRALADEWAAWDDDDWAAQMTYRSNAATLRALLGEPATPPVIDAAHLERQRAWSRETFGPGRRTAGVLKHIRKELGEIEEDPTDVREWVDVAILALDGAWRTGAEPQEIIDALKAKQARNEGRSWPDWRTLSEDDAIEHVREEPQTGGVDLITAERRRQIEDEGWTPQHDAEHDQDDLALAAACYVLPPGARTDMNMRLWPWESNAWKPTPQDRIRELVKAGALIAAEIDRLARQPKRELTSDEAEGGEAR